MSVLGTRATQTVPPDWSWGCQEAFPDKMTSKKRVESSREKGRRMPTLKGEQHIERLRLAVSQPPWELQGWVGQDFWGSGSQTVSRSPHPLE